MKKLSESESIKKIQDILNDANQAADHDFLDSVHIKGIAGKPDLLVLRFSIASTGMVETDCGPDEYMIPASNEIDPLMQFFDYDHLPENLREVSRPFAEMAAKIMLLPRNAERTTALRRLLESKDCAVRARLMK